MTQGRTGPDPETDLRDGTLPVLCWCETTIVYVPVEDVRAGLTRAHRPTKKALRESLEACEAIGEAFLEKRRSRET